MSAKEKQDMENENKYKYDRKLSLLKKQDDVDYEHIQNVHNAELIHQSINVVKEQSQQQREKRLSPHRYHHVKSKVAGNLKTQKKMTKNSYMKNTSPQKTSGSTASVYVKQGPSQTVKITDSPTHQRLQEREEEIRRTEAHLENLKSQLNQTKSKLVNDNLQTQSAADNKFSQSAYVKEPKNQSLSNPYYQPSTTTAYTQNLSSANVSPYQNHFTGAAQNPGTISSYNQSSSIRTTNLI